MVLVMAEQMAKWTLNNCASPSMRKFYQIILLFGHSNKLPLGAGNEPGAGHEPNKDLPFICCDMCRSDGSDVATNL